MREWYAWKIQQKLDEGRTIVRAGRLFQPFLVDAYACIEE